MIGYGLGLARPLPLASAALPGVPLALEGADTFGLNLRTVDTQDVTVHWGDGDSDTASVTSGADVTFSHTYDSSFTGNIRIEAANGPTAILLMSSLTGSLGAIRFTTADLAPFTAMTTMVFNNNGIAFGGPAIDLPRSITNLQLGGTQVSPGGLTGAPEDLPPGVTNLQLSGTLNNLVGALADFPDTITSMTVRGTSVITGALQDAPSACSSLHIRGNSTLNGYNGTPWKTGTQNVSLVRLDNSTNALSSTEVDELINDINAQAARPNNGGLFLQGASLAARTSASDAAVTALLAAGWTVETSA